MATLSFMGTAPDLRALWGPCIALFAFLLGVVMCGAMLATRALTTSAAYVRFLADAEKYGNADISWGELASRCSPNHGAALINTLAAITYSCLIIGAAAGVFTVWTRT